MRFVVAATFVIVSSGIAAQSGTQPVTVDDLMRLVPAGKLTTVSDLGAALAKRHGTHLACPMTTGIFAWIASHAAEEDRAAGRADATPWWRTLKSGGVLNPKVPGGLAGQKRRLVAEGHRVARRGKLTVVVDYEKALSVL